MKDLHGQRRERTWPVHTVCTRALPPRRHVRYCTSTSSQYKDLRVTPVTSKGASRGLAAGAVVGLIDLYKRACISYNYRHGDERVRGH